MTIRIPYTHKAWEYYQLIQDSMKYCDYHFTIGACTDGRTILLGIQFNGKPEIIPNDYRIIAHTMLTGILHSAYNS